VQVLYGTQDTAQIVLNTGVSTVYLSDNSNVQVGFDFPLGCGESLVVDADTVLWATSENGGTTLTTLNNYGDRFAPSTPVGRLLSSSTLGTATTNTYSVTVGNGLASHVPGIAVIIRAAGVQLYNTLPSGSWLISWDEQGDANTSGLGALKHAAAFYAGVPAVGFGATVANEPIFSAVFPNTSSRGGVVTVTLPAAYAGGIVEVWATDYPVPATVLGTTKASAVMTERTWVQRGNTWTVDNFTITAGAATSDIYLPPLTGPVRVALSLTQAGAGSLTANLRTQTGTSSTSIQWDTLITSTAAGSLWAGATYGVWPTSVMFMRFVLAAGVTASAATLSLTQGGA
jgi:hypothetical protein